MMAKSMVRASTPTQTVPITRALGKMTKCKERVVSRGVMVVATMVTG